MEGNTLLYLSEHELVHPMLTQGFTVFCFSIDNALVEVFGLENELRPDAVETVGTLQKHGVSVHVVSGDDDGAVQTLANKVCIPGDNVRSRSSPADKKDYIQKLLGLMQISRNRSLFSAVMARTMRLLLRRLRPVST